MSDATRGRVQLFFGDNGDTITDFESIEIRDNYTDPLGSYDFTLRPLRRNINRYVEGLAKGLEVSWTIDNHPQATCLITTRDVSSSGSVGVRVSVHCESPLSVPYQASVDPDISKHFQSDTAITSVVLEALAPYGFTSITGDTAASRAAISGKAIGKAKPATVVQELKAKDCTAQDQETAYGFPARLWTRLGVALRMNEKGELLLGSPDYQQAPGYTLVADFTGARKGNKMLDWRVVDTNDEQFSECVVRGEQADTEGQSTAALPIARVGVAGTPVTGHEMFSATKRQDTPLGGHGYSSRNYPYKPRIIKDKDARDAKRCSNAAHLAMGWRAKDAFVVECTVEGFLSVEGRVWTVDTVATVIIDAMNLNEPMWILERTFVQNPSGGQAARLKLIPLGALVLGGSA